MAAVGGDAPAPMKDDGPDPMTGITIVHKVKSKLGYTEIHTPAPPLDEKGHVSFNENKHLKFSCNIDRKFPSNIYTYIHKIWKKC